MELVWVFLVNGKMKLGLKKLYLNNYQFLWHIELKYELVYNLSA